VVELEAGLAGLRDLQEEGIRQGADGEDVADADVALVEVCEDEVFAEGAGDEAGGGGRVVRLPCGVVRAAV
jgi:hypothetical protein